MAQPHWQHWKGNLNLWESKIRIKEIIIYIYIYIRFKFAGCEKWEAVQKTQAIRLFYLPLFCKIHSSSKTTHKNLTDSNDRFKHLYLGNHSEIHMFVQTFFFKLPILSPPTTSKLPPESPCICLHCLVLKRRDDFTIYEILIMHVTTHETIIRKPWNPTFI